MDAPNTKTVFQTDTAGHFIGTTEADESPMEPGKFHIPRGCVEVPPPESWPDDKWPRWAGKTVGWELIQRPAAAKQVEDNAKPPEDPVLKLQAFLSANPDVAALVASAPPVATE